LQTAVRLLKQRGVELDLTAIPLDDKKTYDSLSRAEAVGLFQLESQGMRRALLDMKPDRFEDIIALVALYRPGPMANIPTYCARKHGYERANTSTQARAILKETYGVIVYQEQVMQARRSSPAIRSAKPICSAAPWARRSARRCRRSARTSSKARPSAASSARMPMRSSICWSVSRIRLQQEPRRGLRAGRLPDRLLEGELSGRVHGGVDDARHGNTDKLSEFRAEAERLDIKSSRRRSIARRGLRGRRQHHLLCAGGAQSVGRQAVDTIVAARGDKPFADLTDFARASIRARHKRVLESLAASVRSIRSSRTAPGRTPRGRHDVDRAAHPRGGFGRAERHVRRAANRETIAGPAVEPWLASDKLQREYDAIGFFLSGHPARRIFVAPAKAEGSVVDRVLAAR